MCGRLFSAIRATTQRGQGRYCSLRCFGHWMASRNAGLAYTRARGGTRADLGFYVRSGWEANWARYLAWLKSRGEIASWDYESETFEFHSVKRGGKFYTPDFKVVDIDGRWHFEEVKGWMDPRSRTKLKRMQKYYPDIEVRVIGRKEYLAVAAVVARLIEHWEGR